MLLLLALGVVWIALSRVPVEAASARRDRAPLPQTGFAAPDFTLHTLDGQTVRLSDLRGQAVLVNFWATWCPPCRAEMPAIQQVYDRYRDHGFTVLAVNLQERDAQVAAFADQFGLTFPILLDRSGDVFERYRVRALPSTFFIDRSGGIRNVTVGGPMTEAFIEGQVVDLVSGGK
ncbi:MAG: redoxin domain-containing protein [Anaerolineae bacterium]|nr:MAG: redoxin domain-containing protein [Anaerolineae bacterium]